MRMAASKDVASSDPRCGGFGDFDSSMEALALKLSSDGALSLERGPGCRLGCPPIPVCDSDPLHPRLPITASLICRSFRSLMTIKSEYLNTKSGY